MLTVLSIYKRITDQPVTLIPAEPMREQESVICNLKRYVVKILTKSNDMLQ